MGRILIGNFKGPKGEKGTDGTDGRRGSRWTQGTAVTGTSTTPAVFSGTGITDALVDDVYMNTETGNIYRCTLSGDAQTAQWAYTGSLKGPTGATGSPGATGATGAVDANTQIEFSDISTYVEMQSGNSIATLFSKIKKGLADLFSGKLDKTKVVASTNITEPGFVMDAKTIADAISQLYSNCNVLNAVPASDFCDFADGVKFEYFAAYVRGKEISIYAIMDTIAAKTQGVCVIKQRYRPVVNYIICDVHSNIEPFENIGTLWITSADRMTILYKNDATARRVYLNCSYMIS